MAIESVARPPQLNEETKRNVTIYTDRQAALRTWEFRTTRASAVVRCHEALSWIRGTTSAPTGIPCTTVWQETKG